MPLRKWLECITSFAFFLRYQSVTYKMKAFWELSGGGGQKKIFIPIAFPTKSFFSSTTSHSYPMIWVIFIGKENPHIMQILSGSKRTKWLHENRLQHFWLRGAVWPFSRRIECAGRVGVYRTHTHTKDPFQSRAISVCQAKRA